MAVGGRRPVESATEKETARWAAKESGNRSTTVACNLQRAWFTNSATFGKHLRGRETCLDGNYVKRFKAEHDQFVDSRWLWSWTLCKRAGTTGVGAGRETPAGGALLRCCMPHISHFGDLCAAPNNRLLIFLNRNAHSEKGNALPY